MLKHESLSIKKKYQRQFKRLERRNARDYYNHCIIQYAKILGVLMQQNLLEVNCKTLRIFACEANVFNISGNQHEFAYALLEKYWTHSHVLRGCL